MNENKAYKLLAELLLEQNEQLQSKIIDMAEDIVELNQVVDQLEQDLRYADEQVRSVYLKGWKNGATQTEK